MRFFTHPSSLNSYHNTLGGRFAARQMCWLAALILVCAGVSQRGEAAEVIVVLANGGKLTGTVSQLKDSDNYLVHTKQGTALILTPGQVTTIVEPSKEAAEYKRLLAQMPMTEEGHWEMAQWCLNKQMMDYYRGHLEQVIKLNPEHEAAHRGLGYSQIDGEWVLQDEYMRSRGFVREGGGWMLAQEIAVKAQQDKVDLAQKEWVRRLKMWRSWINGRKHAEAIANIQKIKDPYAGKALAEALEDPDEIDELKLIYVAVLEKLPSGHGVAAMIDTAINEDDANVREACVAALKRRNQTSAIPRFIAALEHSDNRMVNRAGFALAEFGDERAIMPLIDALETEHKVQIGGGNPGQIGVGFGNGGGGIGVGGGGPKVVKRKLQNSGVLQALTTITGTNFHYDQEGWRDWFADEKTPDQVNLRRGEL